MIGFGEHEAEFDSPMPLNAGDVVDVWRYL